MRRLYICLLTVLLSATLHTASASHFYGADFFYQHISGNTYQVSLVVYGDCSGSAFPNLEGSSAQVLVLENDIAQITMDLLKSSPAVEVTPVCPAEINNTACKNPFTTLPGVMKYVYTAFYTVPYPSTNWIFRFAGLMVKFPDNTQAGRSNSITNLLAPGVVTLEALLNNKTAAGGLDSNNSPVFTTIPTPFYCINIAQQYNQGAVDADNDSLVYALVPGLNAGGTVNYASGYSATSPLHTAPGSFSFSTATGQLNFTPDAIQRSLVVNQVKEYRNGVLVGTASREMTFIVLNNCINSPASSMLDASASARPLGGIPQGNTFRVCQGIDSIHFNVVPLTPGTDTIFASLNGLPAGLKASITQNGTPNPIINIDWKTRNIPVGNYNFFVTYKDNDCPLSSVQTQAYTVQVVQRPKAFITGPDEICQEDTAVFSASSTAAAGSDIAYKWDWHHADYVMGPDAGPWKVAWNIAGEKTVRLVVVENTCLSDEVQKKIGVKPAPYAGISAEENVCLHDSLRVVHFVDFSKPEGQLTYAWSFDGADTLLDDGPGLYVLGWNTPGIKHISLRVFYDGCTGTRRADINVRPLPDARIMNAPGPVCIGDKIFLKATGGESYLWMPQDSLLFAPDGRMYAQILKPSVYRVKVTSAYDCIDTAVISYNEVEPCCNFAYPNAFSPNGDGRNDRFRAVTYGNHLRYELSIYNNWGQRVYYGLDAHEGWDGLFNGKPCDAGTYFYYLNATCFTGRQESHKGNLMLIR